MKIKANKLNIIFGITASIGVVSTVILSIKAIPKVCTICMDKNLTETKDILKACVKPMIPTYVSASITLTTIIAGMLTNKKIIDSLSASVIMLNNLYSNYRNKVIELYGKEADLKIITSIQGKQNPSNEKKLYHISGYGDDGYIEASEIDILSAEYELNKLLAVRGYAGIRDFGELLGLPIASVDDGRGWNLSIENGNFWIDFKEDVVMLEDGLECIDIYYDPTPYLEYIDSFPDCVYPW